MKLVNELIQLTRSEFKCFEDLFTRLKSHGWKHEDDIEYMLTKNKRTRQFTLKELNAFIEWRRPKGTPMATPCYMRFLNKYFKLKKCPSCGVLGHDEDDNVCSVCHGSGRNPEFPARERKK